MGHLRASCPKLPRQYPLSSVVNSVSVNKLVEECMGSKDKVEGYNCIHVPGDNDSCETMQNNDCGGSKLSLGLEKESSELSRDLARCWEVEQDIVQITDV